MSVVLVLAALPWHPARLADGTATLPVGHVSSGPGTRWVGPLPYGTTGVDPVSEDPLPPLEALDVARKLVRQGRPFAAHEVLEARWKAGPDCERDLWQGLAQICVGLTHAARGNTIGATRLLERGAARIDAYAAGGGPAYGLDLTAVAACARGNTGTAY
jgi:hypothetical protein